MITRTSFVLLAVMAAACGGETAQSKPPVAVPPPAPPPATAAADPLGPRPDVAPPPPFVPPTPVVFKAANGITVWLVERHALPVVAIDVAVPSGSANDPQGEGGLAWATATMLDEGAGSRGALEFARAVDQLGATLTTGAAVDRSEASLFVLKRNLAPAFALLGDAVVRPRFDAGEWKRVRELWGNELKARARDPQAVASVVAPAALYGAGQPYGHPASGTTSSAAKVDLARIKRFYQAHWRPDQATLVAVGDVTRAELTALIDQTFADWKAPASPPPPKPAPPVRAEQKTPRVVLVDRPDAPQSMVVVIRPGPVVSDPDVAILHRANIALGGSFTSRLNSDLREEHGWTYGAGSRVVAMRQAGSVLLSAAVLTQHTGDALKAMWTDADVYATKGPTPEEVELTRMTARAQMVQAYQHVSGMTSLLASDAALGLPPTYQPEASARRDAATKADLDRVAARYFNPKESVAIIVGPMTKVLPQLEAHHLPKPELYDAEGNPKR